MRLALNAFDGDECFSGQSTAASWRMAMAPDASQAEAVGSAKNSLAWLYSDNAGIPGEQSQLPGRADCPSNERTQGDTS